MPRYINRLLAVPVFLFAIILTASFQSRNKTWIAIGDSITYLNDHPEETGGRVSKGYLTGVTEQIRGLHYINQGHNGWTAGEIADQIDSLGIPSGEIYSVFLGTNDWWQGRPVGVPEDYKTGSGNLSFYSSLRIIIRKIRSLNAQARLVLITPMQRADFVYVGDANNNAYGSYKARNGQMLEGFANAVDSIGKWESIPVIDLFHDPRLKLEKLIHFKRLKDSVSGGYRNYPFPESARIPFNPATDEYPYPEASIAATFDGLHPSDEGNAIIAKAVVTEFKKFGPF